MFLQVVSSVSDEEMYKISQKVRASNNISRPRLIFKWQCSWQFSTQSHNYSK